MNLKGASRSFTSMNLIYINSWLVNNVIGITIPVNPPSVQFLDRSVSTIHIQIYWWSLSFIHRAWLLHGLYIVQKSTPPSYSSSEIKYTSSLTCFYKFWLIPNGIHSSMQHDSFNNAYYLWHTTFTILFPWFNFMRFPAHSFARSQQTYIAKSHRQHNI